jgi:hypothetical protein
MITFSSKVAVLSVKIADIFAIFFGETLFKIIKLIPSCAIKIINFLNISKVLSISELSETIFSFQETFNLDEKMAAPPQHASTWTQILGSNLEQISAIELWKGIPCFQSVNLTYFSLFANFWQKWRRSYKTNVMIHSSHNLAVYY